MTFETLKWEYTFATDVLIAIRDESPLVCRAPGAPDVSEHSHFGISHIGTSTIRDCTTALFQVTMYRQFARKVGTSANSALICYYLLRLKLSRSTRDRKWTNGYYLEIAFNPLDPIEISENRSEILGRSAFLTKYGSIWFFHNNWFNIECLSLQVTFILIKIELPTKWYRTRPCILHTYYWSVISLPALQRSFI